MRGDGLPVSPTIGCDPPYFHILKQILFRSSHRREYEVHREGTRKAVSAEANLSHAICGSDGYDTISADRQHSPGGAAVGNEFQRGFASLAPFGAGPILLRNACQGKNMSTEF